MVCISVSCVSVLSGTDHSVFFFGVFEGVTIAPLSLVVYKLTISPSRPGSAGQEKRSCMSWLWSFSF